MARVSLPGRPLPYPRSAGGQQTARFTPPEFATWLSVASMAIHDSGVERGLTGPVGVTIAVRDDSIDVEVLPLAGSTHELVLKMGRNPIILAGAGHRGTSLRGDLDNYAKAVCDAIQFVEDHPAAPVGWIVNDSQVVLLVAWFASDGVEPSS